MNNYIGTVAWNVQDLLRQFPYYSYIKAQSKNKQFQELDIVLMLQIIQNQRVSM